MKRIVGLDALRAIAVLLVIKTHWGPNGFNTFAPLDFIVRYILPSGDAAVDFFFVLSGFLITGILLRSKRPTSNLSQLKTFIIRRSLRIFPIYFLFLVILYAANYPGIRDNIGYYATYTSNYLTFNKDQFDTFSHTWSLAVEEQFYLLWPVLILFTPNRYLFKWMLVTVILSTAAHIISDNLYGSFASVLTVNCFNAFAVGGLYAYVLHNKTIMPAFKRFLSVLFPIAVVLYIAQYLYTPLIPLRFVHAVIAIALIARITEQRYSGIEANVLENKLLNSLGKVSYGIYLFHYVIPYYYGQLLSYVHAEKAGNWLKLILYTPLIAESIQLIFVIALAYFSFYVFESRFLQIKDLFKYKVKQTAAG